MVELSQTDISKDHKKIVSAIHAISTNMGTWQKPQYRPVSVQSIARYLNAKVSIMQKILPSLIDQKPFYFNGILCTVSENEAKELVLIAHSTHDKHEGDDYFAPNKRPQ